MDDASSLISDLLAKLADLDDKVASYRKDMAAEFQRHSDDLLRHVPAKVSDEVNRAIAVASRSGRYPGLYPGDQDTAGRSTHTDTSAAGESPASPTIDHTRWDGHSPSPPPVLHHTSGTPSASLAGVVNGRALGNNLSEGPARDPHAREREFHGLFTPSYLPLLESSDRIPHSPPQPVLVPAPAQAIVAPPTLSMAVASVDPPSSEALQAATDPSTPPATTDISSTNSPTMANSGGIAPRIPPVRSFTDPSADCRSGSNGRSPLRRSALRRSSSSSTRTSPRRVRFEFEGGEVLPTSPPDEEDDWQDETPTAAGTLPVVTTTEASPTPAPRDSLSGPTASVFDDGDEVSPPPKKVSSSQALRALSKLPLENPGTWTVVNPGSDLVTPLFRGTRPAAQRQAASFPTTNSVFTNTAAAHVRLRSPLDPDDLEIQSVTNPQLGSPLQDLEAYPDDASDSDDDFVSMPVRQGRKRSISPESRSPLPSLLPTGSADVQPQSPSSAPAVGSTKAMTTPETPGKNGVNGKSAEAVKKPKPGGKIAVDDTSEADGEDFFEMEDDDSRPRTKRETRPYIEEDESESDDEHVDTVEVAAHAAAVEAQVLSHSLTPSRPFTGSGVGGDPLGSPATVPVSVGSYKGRPISFDIIKDPMVHQKAAELGNLPTFVGSVHDSADPTSSFRGGSSLPGGGGSSAFAGTPRSLVERLMLEEMVDHGGVPTRR
ncbi:hypothetical protein GGTG_01918 [Gaeumannomyces tritici R3-111a-1]|uniref:Uncharacterized protein n=1 Tax=Gaeumannomyces tritici (strain R3-111a-1) TaxID=644352 RepID=J3NKX7_GAET3|nr:hypothetical protein GGTG_01918 [Gaeumannomyces tritici R3-111a-1]EJT81944.1 hypothetical protein GGTG_01918 [Gaeumannomyces tritici R3-111a-1]